MSHQLKILHFITNSCRHKYLSTIVDCADRSQFNITIASLTPAGELQDDNRTRGVQTLALDAVRRSQYPRVVLRLASWLRRNRIDVIQTHLYDASLVGLAAAQLARTPLAVFTGHHSHEMSLYSRKLPLWTDCLSSRWMSHYIIAPSMNMKEIFMRDEGVPEERIAVIPHGFDFKQWNSSTAARERVRAELGLNGKTVFGAVGRLYWIKDYPTLLKAFAPLAAKVHEARLLIVGDGDQTQLRQTARELGIEDKVIFTGQRTDVVDVIAAMDVFAHSSLAESFGLVIIEAMAMGKPVVSTNVGVSRDVIESGVNGFLVPTADPEAFSAALDTMLQNRPRWTEMGEEGQRRARTFTANKMVAGYEAHYIKWLTARGKLSADF